MKRIEAIIRPEALKAVVEALAALGYPGLTIAEVRGHGRQRGHLQWRGAAYSVEFLPKVSLQIVAIDADVPDLLQAITRGARTGEPGDGKIFVSEIQEAVRIRTNDYDENAI